MSEVHLAASRPFRLGGYATGDYMCKCMTCGGGFTGDKRAITCLPCAADRLNTARDEGAGTMEVDDLASAARTMLAASGPFLTIWKLNEPLRLADELPLAQVIPGAWPNVEDLRKLYEASEKLRAVLANGQEVTSPADGSQVEPSTTGTGRHIPLEPPPFIQWNGGENPAPGKVVEVKLRNGNVFLSLADHLRWDCIDRPGDIIAYRIIPTDDQGGEGT